MARSSRSIVRRVFVAAALGVVIAGCESNTTTGPSAPPPDPVPFSAVILREGTGGPATNGTPVTLHYTGWLYDDTKPDNKGTQFDTTSGGNPIKLFVGFGSYIEGFHRGLVGMRAGELRRVIIPPSMAYGQTPSVTIPANSTLVFELEVISIP